MLKRKGDAIETELRERLAGQEKVIKAEKAAVFRITDENQWLKKRLDEAEALAKKEKEASQKS